MLRTGLIGRDILASRSPWLHEQEARALGMDLRYDLFDFKARGLGDDALGPTMRALLAEGYRGVNVTHPFKTAVMPLLDALHDSALAVGAVNTVQMRELYYATLLKDSGCSSNAARLCELFLTDDLAFKRDRRALGLGLPSLLNFVIRHTGVKAGLAQRLRAIVNAVQNGSEIARELVETRCSRGAQIARQLRFSEDVADGIQGLDEHWDGSGHPQGLQGEEMGGTNSFRV